jgi:hypothetical protein
MKSEVFKSLLDAATPPKGFTFDSGIWFTHDVDHPGLTLGVAPALAGCADIDPRRRMAATRDLSGKLAVIASWDRVTARPPTSRITLNFGPIGRRQHAKFAILRFRGPRGRPALRALVTSANLTAGGLGRNLELLVVEDSDGTGALARELTAAIRRYAALPDLAVGTRSRILGRLGDLGTKSSASPVSVLHSFGPDEGVLEQLKRLPSTAGATALTVIDPGFARGDFQKVARALHETFPKVTSIRVVGQENELGELQFSNGLRLAIEERFGATPTFDSVTRDRTLHAKAMAWTGPDGGASLLGSANLTSSGLLGGRNLELGVVVDGVAITKVRTRPCPVGITLVQRPDEKDQGLPLMTGVGSITGTGPRQTLSCVIDIEVHGEMPTATWTIEDAKGMTTPLQMTLDGASRRLLCHDLLVAVDQDNWHVWVHAGSKSCVVPLDLKGWKWPDDDALIDVEDPIPSALVQLFTSIQTGVRKRGASVERAPGGASDVLSKPDASLVHLIAKALRSDGGHGDLVQLAQVLADLESTGRLTAGEHWALRLLMETPSPNDDPRGHRIATALGGLR